MQETTDQPPPTVVAEKSPMTEARIAAEAEGDDVFEVCARRATSITCLSHLQAGRKRVLPCTVHVRSAASVQHFKFQ
eukprot:6172325-Pleurochrysis_carterae.AAC.3